MPRSGFKLRSIFPVVICSAVVVLTAVCAIYILKGKSELPLPQSGLNKRTIAVGSARLSVEVAATDEEQKQGLSDRVSLSNNSGMLFTFAVPAREGFWMKGMNFPLDFVYLCSGRVVELKENVQPELLPVPFFPNEPVDAVLEVNAGFIKEHGIAVGGPSDY
jgi:uncharacterized protein